MSAGRCYRCMYRHDLDGPCLTREQVFAASERVSALKQKAFDDIVEAFAIRTGPWESGESARIRQARRNGMLDLYCLLTGEDPEAVYESVQETVIARHERAIAERN